MKTIEKIRQKIEELYDGEAPKHDQQCDFSDGYFTGVSVISNFLDTLEEQECPEYCIRSHCIGCSKYNPDKWSNKPVKAKIKLTGEVIEGFTDGQGHFDEYIDHDSFIRYNVDELKFDTLEESEKPMNPDGLEVEIQRVVENYNKLVYGSKVMKPSGIEKIARHFAQWGAEHSGSSETSKEDKLRYCVEYINPCFPLLDNGDLNVRHLRVPDEHWAEMAITLILSFGGKIYALYRGNVKDGKLADWPTPMIVESEDWLTDEWLHELMDCGHNCL